MFIESVCHRIILKMPLVGTVSKWGRWTIYPLFLGSLVLAGAGFAIYMKVQSSWKKNQETKLKLEEQQRSKFEEEKYQKARDTVIVWKAILHATCQTTAARGLEEALKTKEQTLKEASRFSLWFKLHSCEGISELDIVSQNMTSLPDEIEQLKNLRTLNLEGNRFSTVPSVIRKFTQLHYLNFNNNQLTAIPDWIGELRKLRLIDLRSNMFKNPSEVIAQFPSEVRVPI